MNNTNYFKDLFESIPDYRKIVFLLFLIKNERIYYVRLVSVNVILIV